MDQPEDRKPSYLLVEWTWRDDKSLAFAQLQRYDSAELALQNQSHRLNHSEIDSNYSLIVIGRFGDFHGATHTSRSLFAQECLKSFLNNIAVGAAIVANPDSFSLLPLIV